MLIPVSDDEVLHGVILIFCGCGIAVPQQQLEPGVISSLQHGTHIEHRLHLKLHFGPFIRLCVALVLEEGHPDSELSCPAHINIQGTEMRKTTRVETSGFDRKEATKSSLTL